MSYMSELVELMVGWGFAHADRQMVLTKKAVET
jgi:hypothetical protein